MEWAGSSLLTGDLGAGVTAIKNRHDEVHVIGRLDLVQSLLQHGLVDRLGLWLYPVVLGTRKQVFGSGTVPAALELNQSTTYPSGSVHRGYELAGTPTYGNMADA